MGHASVKYYIIEDMCKEATEKVTRIEMKLEIHEVTIQVLQPINYKTIAKESNAWGSSVSILARPI